jgi:hypothetical protein
MMMNGFSTQNGGGKNIEKKGVQFKYVVLPVTKTDINYTQNFETRDIHEAMIKINDQIKNGLGDWVIVTSVEEQVDNRQ